MEDTCAVGRAASGHSWLIARRIGVAGSQLDGCAEMQITAASRAVFTTSISSITGREKESQNDVVQQPDPVKLRTKSTF